MARCRACCPGRLPTRRRTSEERLDEAIGLLTAQAGEIAMLRAEVSALRAAVGELSSVLRPESVPRLEDILAGALVRPGG
uniref:Uncharacterized protein n=1 Tax=uncultured Armatimonadetes bacterium TaxID=157466 RepID=A0A6J4JXR8_9BACT|nr:hypothetical protein AVDCRST_MAG63-4269 [uncultured Armatimonadetes bacterium]